MDDATRTKLLEQLARGETTWANALGLSRTEVYGIAHAAHRLLGLGQVELARKIVESLIVLNPQDGYFHAFLGAIRGQEGDEDAALRHYDDALARDSKNLAARVNRAELYLRRGKLEPALDDLTAATRIDPEGKTPLGKRAVGLARGTAAAMHEALGHKKPLAPSAAPEKAPVKKSGFFGKLFGTSD